MNNKHSTTLQETHHAWLYMSLYWFLGLLIAWRMGYLSRLVCSQDDRGNKTLMADVPRMAAALVTLVSQSIMTRRFDSFGRKHNPLASLAFALGNGFGETFWFLGIYDLGRRSPLTEWLDLSRPGAATLGLGVFCIYSALIHALFWMRVFPRHIKPDATPFLTHGLPPLVLISIAWLGLYEFYDDILTICELHTLMGFWFATFIALPAPTIHRQHETLYRDHFGLSTGAFIQKAGVPLN